MKKAKVEKKVVKKTGYKPIVPAVDQALELLMCLAESSRSELTLTEICAQLGIHKSKGFTILNTLKRFDFIEKREQTKTYSLGLGIVYLARNVLKRLDIRTLAMPFLKVLAERTKSTAHYGQISGERLYIVARCDVREDLDYGLREGSHYHITHGSHGKAIAAFLPEEKRAALLSGERLDFYGDGETVDFAQLRREIAKCQETGYAVDPGETNPGMIVTSAPVFKHNGNIVGAIILAGNFMHTVIEQHGPAVAETARDLSKKLRCEVCAPPRG